MIEFIKNKKVLVFFLLSTVLYIVFKAGNTFVPIEKLAVPSAIGCEISNSNTGIGNYEIPASIYAYNGGEVTSTVIEGEGVNIPLARENRHLQARAKYIIGLEKAVIAGEKLSRFGLVQIIDTLFSSKTVNDTAYMVVSKQHPADILKLKIVGLPSAGDFIDGLIQSAQDLNFFSDKYKLVDVFLTVGSEGRNLVLPYIEIKDNKIQITGTAIFKDDKMVEKLNMDDTRILNILRNNNVRGTLGVTENLRESAQIYVTSKHKVKCYKNGDKYRFDIDLSLKGELQLNTLPENVLKNPEFKDTIAKETEVALEKKCREFIKDVQTKHKVDCLDLGKYAVAKVGRHTGTDWNEVISNAEINVNADVKITEIGRGDY